MITPMQELIEWIYTIISVLPDGSGAKNQMIIAKEKAESMLDKEKEVIEKAYIEGLTEEIIAASENKYYKNAAELYYTETFNTEE